MTRSSQDQPANEALTNPHRDRRDQIARRIGASIGLNGDRLEQYVKTLVLSFEPEDTATGTVLDPAQAQRAQIRQMISDWRVQIALLLLLVLYVCFLAIPGGGGGA